MPTCGRVASSRSCGEILGQTINTPNEEALAYAHYAYEYIDAARVVDQGIGCRVGYEFVSPTPAYFLALHGIELTLKSFLIYRGMTAQQLRSRANGHDLRALYRKSKELGLLSVFKIAKEDVIALALLVRLNNYQGLRYKTIGRKRFPSWAIVEPLAVRLHQEIASVVGYKSFEDSFVKYV